MMLKSERYVYFSLPMAVSMFPGKEIEGKAEIFTDLKEIGDLCMDGELIIETEERIAISEDQVPISARNRSV